MNIAVIQASFPFADPKRNAARLLELVREAQKGGAELCIAPELSISGVLPRDFLLDHHFAENCRLAVQWLAEELGREGPSLLVGSPMVSSPKGESQDARYARRQDDRTGLLNCAVLVADGEMRIVAAQRHLPAETNHDFPRYFSSGWGGGIFTLSDLNFAVVMGYDVIACAARDGNYMESLLRGFFASRQDAGGNPTPQPPRLTPDQDRFSPLNFSAGISQDKAFPLSETEARTIEPDPLKADVVLCLAAVPFSGRGGYILNRALAELAGNAEVPVVFANAVSAAGGTLFAGGSQLLSRTGVLHTGAKLFEEEIFQLKAQREDVPSVVPGMAISGPTVVRPIHESGAHHAHISKEESLFKALRWGLKRYVEDHGFSQTFLGLSGGLDSAVCAAIAVESLGASSVCGVLMPSPHTSRESTDWALLLAENLGIATKIIPIAQLMSGFDDLLAESFAGLPPGITEENLQARIRGALLMALSNKLGGMVICPSNKSELAVGYSTLYGDCVGAIAPIGDIYKSDVYALARWYNEHAGREIIPAGIIERPPTAELSPGQLDADALPPYPVLDDILRNYVEEGRTSGEIKVPGADEALVAKVIKLVRCAEFKRRQTPPVLEVSMRPFGPNWRMPL